MVVDMYLSQDRYSRVACETLTTTNKVVLAGETRGPKLHKDELVDKVRNCIKDIGYDQSDLVGNQPILIFFYMTNHLILRWELIQKITKMKVQETKE